MRGRIAAAALAVAALAFALAPAQAPAAAPSSCIAYAEGVGNLLGVGASLLRESANYAPLITKAAYAGIDDSASAIAAVAKQTSAIDAKLTALGAGVKAATTKAVAEGRACGAAASRCVALTVTGAQLLGILASAVGDAGGYRSLITAAAKAGHDNDAAGLQAVVKREEQLTAQINQLDARLTKAEARIHPLEQACER